MSYRLHHLYHTFITQTQKVGNGTKYTETAATTLKVRGSDGATKEVIEPQTHSH